MIRYTLLACALCVAVPAHHAAAQTYKYLTVKYKARFGSGMTDINNKGLMVGGYFSSISDVRQCFTYDLKTHAKTTPNAPNGAGGTECWGLNDAGTIVGDYIDSTGIYHGFVYSGTTYTTIDPPGSTKTVVYGVSNTGIIGGYYVDSASNQHGFLYDGTTYTTADIKGATGNYVFGVNASGEYILDGVNSKNVTLSYLYNGSTITPITFTGAKDGTAAHHLSDTGLVSATWLDSSDVDHGGVYDSVAKAYYDITFPNSSLTVGDGINKKMQVVGRYVLTSSTSGQTYGYVAKGKLTPHK